MGSGGRVAVAVLAALAVEAAWAGAGAQPLPALPPTLPPTLPTPAQPGRPPERAAPSEIPQGQVELSIPASRRAPEGLEVDEIKFQVREVILDGMTAFDRREVQPQIEPLLNRPVTLREMIALADALEARYRDAGYVLSRVVVPPQRIDAQTFRIQIIEGYVKAVVVEGGSPTVRELIESLVAPVVMHRPARLADLERGLLLANDLPGVTAAGVIRPGSEVGAADLAITVTEKTWDALMSANNRGSPFGGTWSLYSEGSIYNALGQAEQITLGFAASPDFQESRYAALRYLQPLGYDGLAFGFEASYSNGDPGFTLAALKAHSQSHRFGPRLAYPLIRSRAENLTFDTGVAFASVATDLLGQQFNRENYRVFDFRATYSTAGWFGGATALIGLVTQGLDEFSATPAGDRLTSRLGAAPDFTKLNGEVKHIQPLFDEFGGKFSLALSGYAQYAFSTVYSAEGFAIGGGKVGRGYDPAELIGDHGLAAATELRFDDTITDIPYLSSYQLYGFYDVGEVWNRTLTLGPTRALSSAGAGIRLISTQGITFGFEIAQPLTRGVSTENNDKPTRFYFDLSFRF